jgi:alpha-glucosidase (family GH31 glycosyl hydrolase)
VAGWYGANHVPLDEIIQDWQYWTPHPWGSHEFDTSRDPDTKEMMKQPQISRELFADGLDAWWRVTSEGCAMVRPLVMDFQTDTNVFDPQDEYLLGRAISDPGGLRQCRR